MLVRLAVLLLVVAVAGLWAPVTQANTYEVWVIDQANVPDGGDRLYIYTPGNWTEPKVSTHTTTRGAVAALIPGHDAAHAAAVPALPLAA